MTTLEDSILGSIKDALDIDRSDDAFDNELIMFINGVFSELWQLGVGPDSAFSIGDKDSTWSEFTTNVDLSMVFNYMYLEVRLIFDPPTASLLSALERKRDEYEWRLNVAADNPDKRGAIANGITY